MRPRLLLVDDEMLVLDGIYEMIRGSGMLFEMERASSGLEALHCAMLHEPDILVTDVRMPKMDGIKLAEHIREAYPKCRIIFLSSYSDKEYLKSAIHLQAVDYIDKQAAENSALVAALKKALRTMREENEAEANHRNAFLGAQKLLKIQFCQALTVDGADYSELLSACRKYLMEELFTQSYRCLLLHGKENGLTGAEKLLRWKYEGSYLEYRRETRLLVVFLHAQKQEPLSDDDVRALADDICRNNQELYISCGGISGSYETAYRSFVEASEAAEQYFFSGERKVQFYVRYTKRVQLDLNARQLRDFRQCLYSFQLSQCLAHVDMIVKSIGEYPQTSIIAVKTFWCSMVDILFTFAEENRFDFAQRYNRDAMYDRVWKAEKLSALKNALKEWLMLLFSAKEALYSQEHIIRIVLVYIHNNLKNQNLDISRICEFTKYSSSYLCRCFKASMGQTINHYIMQKRIERAGMLLLETNDTLNVIAEETGFGSVQYFCKIFKKKTGVSPGDYREAHKN